MRVGGGWHGPLTQPWPPPSAHAAQGSGGSTQRRASGRGARHSRYFSIFHLALTIVCGATMASGATLEKLRQLYSRTEAEVKRWATLQVQRTARAAMRLRSACMLAAAAAAAATSNHAAPSHRLKQEQALSLLGTIANVLSRLPALEDGGAYGALAALPGHPHLKERLLAKQLAALDELIMQLQGYLGDMQVGVSKDSGGLQACAWWRSGGCSWVSRCVECSGRACQRYTALWALEWPALPNVV